MLIGASDGQGWRYEVMEREDAYVVRMRDLDSGMVEETEGRLFRTAMVAFAYADLSACTDRYTAARLAGELDAELTVALAVERLRFKGLSARLGDEGLPLEAVLAWENATVEPRRVLH